MPQKKNKKQVPQVRRAVALHYKPEQHQAPRVAATGKGWLAERIITLAKENSVPIVKDDGLSRVLASLPLGEEVPQELYEAVAAIYAFVMEADQRLGRGGYR